MMRRMVDTAAISGRSPSRRESLCASALLGLGLGMSPALAAAPRPDERVPVLREQARANGASSHVVEQGRGPAVLFCHGFPDTAETCWSQMRAVAQAGFRAVALDMRGYGASYVLADVSLYTALHTVGDLVGVLDALDIRSAVLVGHDWGADVVQKAMAMRPDRFCAVISLSIPFVPRGEISTWNDLRRWRLGLPWPLCSFHSRSHVSSADQNPRGASAPERPRSPEQQRSGFHPRG